MPHKQWFETWFDSPYYHQLYCNRDENEAQSFITNLTQHLTIPIQSRVLDVACGKGRHSRYLASQGYDTTGIDLSPHSIAFANLDTLPHLRFAEWDMRKVYKEGYFDLVVNLFSSFGYFDAEADDQAAIKAMADNLKPNGILVLDYLNAEAIVKRLKPRDIIDRGDIQFHIKKRIENGFIKKEIDFIANGEDQHYEEQLKIIKPTQFEKLFNTAGLKITQLFGSYDLAKFDAATSLRQVIIAIKQPA